MHTRLCGLILTLFCLAAGIGICAAEDAPKFDVQAIGVRVSKPSALKESTVWPSGTALLLQISSERGEFVRLDLAASNITKITDDAGNNMLAKIQGIVDARQIVGISRAFQIDKERKVCLLEAVTPLLPAKGSKAVLISGVAVMDCAEVRKETVVEKVSLRSGTKFTGPDNLELAIEQVGRPAYGRDPLSFVLRSERELDNLAEVKFFKATGEEIKSSRTSSSFLSINGASKIEWTYVLGESVDSATVKIYTWSEVKKKKAEFELKVELGL